MRITSLCACAVLLTSAVRADLTPVFLESHNQQQNAGGPIYFQNVVLAVGQGAGFISYQTSDTFAEFSLGAFSGPVPYVALAGSVDNLYLEPPLRYLQDGTFAQHGVYAYLTVDVRVIAPTGTDAASLFAAYQAGTSVGSFTIDDGVTPPPGISFPPGAPVGPNFALVLSSQATALAEAARLAGLPFWLGFGGQGVNYGGTGIGTPDVVGDLSFSAQLPEPSALALLGTAALALSILGRLARRTYASDVR
jgi:hypothetical protein